MKTRLISYLFMIVTFIVSSFSFMSCSNDIENYIIIPGQNGTEYVKKDGSNFILNVGDSNYSTSTQTRAMMSSTKNAPQVVTYSGIDGSSITATAATNLLDLTVATNYSNNLWSETLVSKDVTPDVITNIDMVIDNLCVKGAVVTDPDGANDSNVIWNIYYEYGSMDGQWSIGK